tara:strand:+ start:1312 stop:2823 length:1512 start_codon:yes stop_codon:yes gene_type:complete
MTSKIKVDNIENQCGGAVVTKCGGTTTISGSVVKANNIQASDGGNLVSQSGTTITLGASGDTINLASGASQSGFGRTGTVDWQTGSIKTATFTAASGEGYFANTTGSAFNMNLPAGSAGAIVSVADYAETFNSNNLTIVPNGSDKIGGVNEDAVLNTKGQSVTLVYVDGTQGWINTMDSTSNVRGAGPFIEATGGTVTTSGNFKIHTFTGPGTFEVTNAGNACGSTTADYMVVAGGAGGGGAAEGGGGGGGAGGYRESSGTASGSYSASPLGSGVPALPLSVQSYPIVVGAGGTAAANGRSPGMVQGTNGSNSSFSTITSTGGGTGTHVGMPYSTTLLCGSTGGSGGGGAGGGPSPGSGASFAGNTPPVSPPQGNPGGTGQPGPSTQIGGGGGGATAAGSNETGSIGGAGGAGATSSINATPTARAGGGGGGGRPNCAQGAGGSGGGGAGSKGDSTTNATSGTANTGGGGGGGGRGEQNPTTPTGGGSGAGGSGIVIIRYKFQ